MYLTVTVKQLGALFFAPSLSEIKFVFKGLGREFVDNCVKEKRRD
jgi:hypothetical protein